MSDTTRTDARPLEYGPPHEPDTVAEEQLEALRRERDTAFANGFRAGWLARLPDATGSYIAFNRALARALAPEHTEPNG